MTTETKHKPLESHDTHSKRLIRHAEEQLAKGDRLQASEKAWGAVAHRAKVIANRMGWTYDTHTDFFNLQHRIAQMTDDPVLTRRLLRIAQHLHTNYYRDQYPIKDLRTDLKDVKELLAILDGPQFRPPVRPKTPHLIANLTPAPKEKRRKSKRSKPLSQESIDHKTR